MPAESKAQQALMALVYQYLNGDLTDVSDEVKNIAKNMTKEQAKEFASTKTKNLPSHVKENVIANKLSFSQFVQQLNEAE